MKHQIFLAYEESDRAVDVFDQPLFFLLIDPFLLLLIDLLVSKLCLLFTNSFLKFEVLVFHKFFPSLRKIMIMKYFYWFRRQVDVHTTNVIHCVVELVFTVFLFCFFNYHFSTRFFYLRLIHI